MKDGVKKNIHLAQDTSTMLTCLGPFHLKLLVIVTWHGDMVCGIGVRRHRRWCLWLRLRSLLWHWWVLLTLSDQGSRAATRTRPWRLDGCRHMGTDAEPSAVRFGPRTGRVWRGRPAILNRVGMAVYGCTQVVRAHGYVLVFWFDLCFFVNLGSVIFFFSHLFYFLFSLTIHYSWYTMAHRNGGHRLMIVIDR